jgi:hypothetical protein
MKFPDYYKNIEPIVLFDELAMFLGAPEDGKYEIHYQEIVKMAGHSCATVAGAYLITFKGLESLYENEIPKRGEIKVEVRDSAEEGSIGVSASIFTNITGAAGGTGFAGINGKYARRNLLSFNAKIDGFVRFTRMDTGKSVEVNYNPANVVYPGNIMMSAIGPQATEETKRTFPFRWKEMIGTIFNNIDKVIEVR